MTGIYKITNLTNGKIYIGQAQDIEERWKQHVREFNRGEHHNTYLQNSWNKYGADNFSFEILCECAIDALDEAEVYYIDTLNSYFYNKNSNGYNMTLGGGGTRGRVLTEEQLSKLRVPCKEETKKKISIANSGYRNGMYGGKPQNSIRVICVQTCEIFDSAKSGADKYNTSNSGIIACCKARQKSSGKFIDGTPIQWMYYDDYISGATIEPYTRNTPAKKILCITTGEVFDSGVVASEHYGCNKTHISSCCTGRRNYCGVHPETGERLEWAYYENFRN